MELKAVIYDFDGLLADSEAVYGITLTQVLLEDYDVKDSFKAVSTLTAGKSIEKAFRAVEDHYGIKLKENALDRWDTLANEYFATKLQLCKGVSELLNTVNVKHAIASTSARWKLELKQKSTGLDKYFSSQQTFSGEEVANHKPAPDVYLAAAEGIAEKPEHCIAVEDSVSGVKAGKAAGMYTVGCLGGSHIFDKELHRDKLLEAGADIVINDMSELIDIIDKLIIK